MLKSYFTQLILLSLFLPSLAYSDSIDGGAPEGEKCDSTFPLNAFSLAKKSKDGGYTTKMLSTLESSDGYEIMLGLTYITKAPTVIFVAAMVSHKNSKHFCIDSEHSPLLFMFDEDSGEEVFADLFLRPSRALPHEAKGAGIKTCGTRNLIGLWGIDFENRLFRELLNKSPVGVSFNIEGHRRFFAVNSIAFHPMRLRDQGFRCVNDARKNRDNPSEKRSTIGNLKELFGD